MQRRSTFIKTMLAVLALTTIAGTALAQGYPNKAIKLQIPFAPGGTPTSLGA